MKDQSLDDVARLERRIARILTALALAAENERTVARSYQTDATIAREHETRARTFDEALRLARRVATIREVD